MKRQLITIRKVSSHFIYISEKKTLKNLLVPLPLGESVSNRLPENLSLALAHPALAVSLFPFLLPLHLFPSFNQSQLFLVHFPKSKPVSF